MDMFERLARRYCAFLGEDPDEQIEGLPVWRIALCDLEAALNALDTFGVDARGQLKEQNGVSRQSWLARESGLAR